MKWLQLRVQLFVDWRANKYETRCVGRRLDAFERMLLGRTVDRDLIVLYRITTSYSRVIRQIFLTISWKSKNFPSLRTKKFSLFVLRSQCKSRNIFEKTPVGTNVASGCQDFFLLSFFPAFFPSSPRVARIIYEAREREDRQRKELITVLGTKNRPQRFQPCAVKLGAAIRFLFPPWSGASRKLEEKKRRERERERKKAEAEEKKRRVGALDLEKVQFRASRRLRGRGKRIETRRRVERPSDRMDIFTLTPRCLRVTREGVAFWNDSPRFQTFPLAYESASFFKSLFPIFDGKMLLHSPSYQYETNRSIPII